MALGQNGNYFFSKICTFRGVKMNILVDYLTLSIRQIQLSDLLKILHLENVNMESGYSRWLGHKLYLGGISIHYGDYIILEMSGHGCRFLESLYDNDLDWVNFIEQFLCLEGSHLARLDIACDDRPSDGEQGILSFPTMFRHVMQRRYISLSRYVVHTGGSEQSIYFGSPKSDRRLRIYNKALERGVPDEHWIRAEFQLRNEAALSFYMRALELHSIGQAYQGMLFDFLRFTREINDSEHTERLTVARWWRTFCGNAKKIKGFYVGGLEYNMESLERYLGNQTSSSMKAYMIAHGGDVSGLLGMAEKAELNDKQQFLVATAPLVQKMRMDYDSDGVQDRPTALSPHDALTFGRAMTDAYRVEQNREHWTMFSSAEEKIAYENTQRILDQLAKNDLPF